MAQMTAHDHDISVELEQVQQALDALRSCSLQTQWEHQALERQLKAHKHLLEAQINKG